MIIKCRPRKKYETNSNLKQAWPRINLGKFPTGYLGCIPHWSWRFAATYKHLTSFEFHNFTHSHKQNTMESADNASLVLGLGACWMSVLAVKIFPRSYCTCFTAKVPNQQSSYMWLGNVDWLYAFICNQKYHKGLFQVINVNISPSKFIILFAERNFPLLKNRAKRTEQNQKSAEITCSCFINRCFQKQTNGVIISGWEGWSLPFSGTS